MWSYKPLPIPPAKTFRVTMSDKVSYVVAHDYSIDASGSLTFWECIHGGFHAFAASVPPKNKPVVTMASGAWSSVEREDI